MSKLGGKASTRLDFQQEFWQIHQGLASCYAVTQELQALWFLALVQAGKDQCILILPRPVLDFLDPHAWLGKPGGGAAIRLIESACEFIEFHLWLSLSS